MIRKAAFALVVFTLILGPSVDALAAASVSSEEFWQLVDEARTDPVALRELLEVESVDGRPYDVSSALGTGSAEEIRDRLETLSSSEASSPIAGSPREEAQRILSDRRFQEPHIPRPLKGPIEWIAQRLRPVGRFFGRILESAARHVPGGEATLWIMLAILVTALVSLLTMRYMRRAVLAKEPSKRRRRGPREEPIDLDKAADKAEAEGDWAEAIRLRFRAGLIRLRTAEIVPDDDVIPNGEIAVRLRLSTFVRLANTFDEVHYGKRQATEDGARDAKSGWKSLYEQLAIS